MLMYFPIGMDMVDFQEEEAESATEALFPRIDTGLCQSGDDVVRASTPRATLWWGTLKKKGLGDGRHCCVGCLP
jgi:hypothetical protein